MAKANGISRSSVNRTASGERSDCSPSQRDLQAVERPAAHREDSRHCRVVSESADHAVVLCVDEKAQIQALDRTQPLLPMRPGQVERRTHDYKRHGTTSLFAALDIKTSRVNQPVSSAPSLGRVPSVSRCARCRGAAGCERASVLDNYGTHKTPIIWRWLAKRPRFHVHFTPTYGSWLNLVERWFAALTTRQLRRGAHRSVSQLEAAIQEFIDAHHTDPKPFVWTKTADEILASIARFAQRTTNDRTGVISRTSETGH
jgi:DDE superfamily endonuclease